MRPIDADALTEYLKCLLPERGMWEIEGDSVKEAICETIFEAMEMVKNMETISMPERRTGRWIYGEDDSGQDGWTCSECGFFVPWYYDYYGLNNIDFIRDFHTCPHCDAKMLTYTGKKMEVEHEVG